MRRAGGGGGGGGRGEARLGERGSPETPPRRQLRRRPLPSPAATPSPARPQGEPEPTRAQTHRPLPNCCRRVLPTRKETTQVAGSKQALRAKNERKSKPQSREVGKPRPGLPHPPPSCKMRLRLERGRGGWVPPYLLGSQDRSSGRSRAARAPRSGKCLPHAAIPSARSAVAHTRTHTRARTPPARGEGCGPARPPRRSPAALPAAAPPPRSPRRTCCQDARRGRCRCSRPWSCAADGGGRSSKSPRPPRGGGAWDPSFT